MISLLNQKLQIKAAPILSQLSAAKSMAFRTISLLSRFASIRSMCHRIWGVFYQAFNDRMIFITIYVGAHIQIMILMRNIIERLDGGSHIRREKTTRTLLSSRRTLRMELLSRKNSPLRPCSRILNWCSHLLEIIPVILAFEFAAYTRLRFSISTPLKHLVFRLSYDHGL